jgi:hypothetical protein
MEHLQGGYEELESDDTDSTDDLPEGFAKTKEGYVKDGFIASSEDSESEDEKPVISKATAGKSKATAKGTKSSQLGADGANNKSEATGKVVKKPVKPRLKKKEEPQVAVYVEELTEDPYF